VRELIRKHPGFFLLGTCAAAGLRIFFLLKFPNISVDSFVYGDIAKNWLQHGIYGLTGVSEPYPTYIRLPGYPAFVALVFAIFGMEHYRAVLFVQMLVDVGTCFVAADLARRMVSERAAKIAFLLAALCPFLANYAAAALSETLEVFFTALALDFAIAGLQDAGQKNRAWLGCGLSCGAAILLRPDGGLLLMSIGLYLIFLFVRAVIDTAPSPETRKVSTVFLVRAGVIVLAISLLPLVPWTVRNWITIHRFQPLAPRYANEADEFAALGFNRWVRTWIADYVSVEEIYWNVPGAPIDGKELPSRAFDSPAEQGQTARLIDAYNATLVLSPQLDQRFDELAAERIHHDPVRYYLRLPFLRIVDMWLRPRTALLPPDPRWWEFNDDWRWSAVAVGFGALNLVYVVLACLGAWKGRTLPGIGMLFFFVVVRSAFLGTLENPEPRYTLEFYPVMIVFAAIFLALGKRTAAKQQ
jgi:4-amino-4-deoxy-L-arabinose transferase-like glycosyltransferase